ncbi:MAG: DUF3592 domain-containing protein [Prevotellaceae bacterium]|jgi:hypothetical protein|nr:DUF3592 domain-containing protein [Prevotellaceae bacterium]
MSISAILLFSAILVFNLYCTVEIAEKQKTRLSILPKGYIFLVLLPLNILIIGLFIGSSKHVFGKAGLIFNSKIYRAEIVDFENIYDTGRHGEKTASYYPVYEFVGSEGEVITLQSDEEDLYHKRRIGETRTVYYNKKLNKLTTVNAKTFISIIGLLCLMIALGTAFAGILMYSLGKDMHKYRETVLLGGVKYFLPFILITFDLLSIYSLIYGNVGHLIVKLLISVLILILTLAIIGYFKKIRKEIIPLLKLGVSE